MAINALIAAGVRPIGADIPQIANMLQDKRQADVRNALLQTQVKREDQQYQQGQEDRQNKVALAQMQWAAQPGLSKDQIAQAVPQIKDGFEQAHGPGSWATASDEDVRGTVQMGIQHFSSKLGVAPPVKAPNTITLKEGEQVGTLSPDGKTWTPVASNAKAEKPSWGNPVDEVRGGRPVRVQYDKDGNARIVDGATPYSKPVQGGGKAPVGYRFAEDGSLEPIPGGPRDPANAKARPIPPAAAQGYIANEASLKKIDQAIEAIKAHPAALGARNFLGDTVRQRTDAEGVDARSRVADVGSLLIHDRSGAAVSASEFPRLAPFVPSSTDSPQAAITKLQNLKRNMVALQEETSTFYSPDAGYAPLPSGRSADVHPDIAAADAILGRKK